MTIINTNPKSRARKSRPAQLQCPCIYAPNPRLYPVIFGSLGNADIRRTMQCKTSTHTIISPSSFLHLPHRPTNTNPRQPPQIPQTRLRLMPLPLPRRRLCTWSTLTSTPRRQGPKHLLSRQLRQDRLTIFPRHPSTHARCSGPILRRRGMGVLLSAVAVFDEKAILSHALAASGFFLDGLEFVEEVGPFDEAFFARFEPVGAVVG